MIPQTQAFDDPQDNSGSYIEPGFTKLLLYIRNRNGMHKQLALLLHLVVGLYLYYALLLTPIYILAHPLLPVSAPLNIFIHTVCDNITLSGFCLYGKVESFKPTICFVCLFNCLLAERRINNCVKKQMIMPSAYTIRCAV